MQIHNVYPGDAARGCDYISGAALDKIVDADTGQMRDERVIITDLYVDHEGRVCIGEKSVKHMATLCGMFEGDRVRAIASENDRLRVTVEAQAVEVQALKEQNFALRAQKAVVVYVTPSGLHISDEVIAQSIADGPLPAPVLVGGDPVVLDGGSAESESHSVSDPPAVEDPGTEATVLPESPAELSRRDKRRSKGAGA